jgi:hypothetical protein
MHNNGVTYSKGRNVYKVTLSVMNTEQTGGFCATLNVRGDSWRDAKRYVQQMDPDRIWPNYKRLLTECGQEPGITCIKDAKHEYYTAPERGGWYPY